MIQVAVVGYGRVGAAHAACYTAISGVRIAAVADTSPPRRRAAIEKHPDAQVGTRLDEITVPIDLALICTPPTSHEPLIEAALRRGAHVFCEKPVFLDPIRARRLVTLAATEERIIYPGHNYVHSPMLKRLREYVQNGAVGRIQHVAIQVERTGPALGTEDWHPHWRTDIRYSAGGILTDHGPHCTYLTEWLSGQQILTISRHTDAGADGIDHHAQLHLSLTSGVTATSTMSWRADARRSLYQVIGSSGEARLENNRLYTPHSQPLDGVHESTASTHTHDDWMPPLAHDVLASLADPQRLHSLTGPTIAVARMLAGSPADPPAILDECRGIE